MAKSKEWAKPAAIGKLSRNERPINPRVYFSTRLLIGRDYLINQIDKID